MADSASYFFSILSVWFAESSRINFVTCPVDHLIRMMDISGNQIPIIGYTDVEIMTVWGNEYKATRMLIMEGSGYDAIIGRDDLKLVNILPANFPMPLCPVAADIESRQRAKTIIEMDDERMEEEAAENFVEQFPQIQK